MGGSGFSQRRWLWNHDEVAPLEGYGAAEVMVVAAVEVSGTPRRAGLLHPYERPRDGWDEAFDVSTRRSECRSTRCESSTEL